MIQIHTPVIGAAVRAVAYDIDALEQVLDGWAVDPSVGRGASVDVENAAGGRRFDSG